MKILHTADWHLGKKLDHFSRLAEQAEVLDEICAIATEEKPDLILIAGDIYDAFNPPTEAQRLLYETLVRLSKNGQIPVLAIAGNHDSPEKIESPDALAQLNGILFSGLPKSRIDFQSKVPGFEVLRSDFGFIELTINGLDYPVRIIHTAYPNENRLQIDLNSEEKEQLLRDYLAIHWKELADQYCDTAGVNLLVTHAFVMAKGGEVPPEPEDEKPINIGGAQSIYSENFPDQMQYVALGHLHRKQIVDQQPCPIVYSSSVLAYSFAEANQTKYVALIDAAPGVPSKVDFLPLTKGKKLAKATFQDIDDAIKWLKAHESDLVEVTIQTKDFLTVELKKTLNEVHPNIIRIIPELLLEGEIPKSKTLASETMEDLFTQYFQKAKGGLAPSQELLDIFKEILQAEAQ